MSEEKLSWSEENSRSFIDNARYAVPDREEQIRVLCALVPDPGRPFEILELACGAGDLAGALLERFPHCTVRGLDRSALMLETARRRLAAFGERFQAGEFELSSKSWRAAKPAYQAVVSSLAIHHLDDAGKADLFRDVYAMLLPGGAFLVADILRPAGPLALEYAASAYDEIVRRQSLEMSGSLRFFDQFVKDEWNLFRFPDDAVDKPSTLLDQLQWLEQAGFRQVDVYWLRAGHAIFGGIK